MARATWKGAVRFGLVTIPVRAQVSVRETRFDFNIHHDPKVCTAGGGRSRMGESVCEGCGETIAKGETVKGYKGKPASTSPTWSRSRPRRAKSWRSRGWCRRTRSTRACTPSRIDLVAEKIGAKPYALLRDVLIDGNQVAIGTLVSGGHEHLVAIRPRAGALAMEMLYRPEELDVASTSEAQAAVADVEVSPKELALGKMLAESLTGSFDATEYRNGWAAQMAAYLDGFLAGEAPAPIEHHKAPAQAFDLEAALAASLAQAKAA